MSISDAWFGSLDVHPPSGSGHGVEISSGGGKVGCTYGPVSSTVKVSPS
jgi:hypothetical protein